MQSSFLDYLKFHKGQQISSPAKNSHNRSSKPSYDSIIASDQCFPEDMKAPSKILIQQKGSSPEGYKNIMLAAHPHKKRSKSNKSKQSMGAAATEGDERNGKNTINYQINNINSIESAQDNNHNPRENRAIHTEQPLEKLIGSEIWPRKRQSQANAQLCQMFERSVLFSPSKTLLSSTQFSCNHQVPSVKVENASISKRSTNQSALVMSSNPLIKPILSQSSNRKLASTCYTLTTEWQIPTTTAKVQTRNPKDRYNPVRSSLDVYPTYHSETAQRRNSYNKSAIAEALTSSRGVNTMHDSLRVSVNLPTKTKNDLDVLLCKKNNNNNRVASASKKSSSGITNKSTCVKNIKNDKKQNCKTRNKSLEKVSLSRKSTGSSATRDNEEVKKTAASARQFPDSTNSNSTQNNKFITTQNTQTTSNNERELTNKQQHQRENSKDQKGYSSTFAAGTSSIAGGNNSATTISTAATASNIFSFSSSSQSSSKTAKTQQNSLNQLLNSLLRATRTEPRSPIGQPPKPNQPINQQQSQPNQKKRGGSSLLSSVSHTQPDERNYLPFKYSEQQNDLMLQRQPYLSQVQCNNLIGINTAPRFEQKYQFNSNINKNFIIPSGKFVDNTRTYMSQYAQRFEEDMRAFQEYNESISKNELFVANLKHPFFSSSVTVNIRTDKNTMC